MFHTRGTDTFNRRFYISYKALLVNSRLANILSKSHTRYVFKYDYCPQICNNPSNEFARYLWNTSGCHFAHFYFLFKSMRSIFGIFCLKRCFYDILLPTILHNTRLSISSSTETSSPYTFSKNFFTQCFPARGFINYSFLFGGSQSSRSHLY